MSDAETYQRDLEKARKDFESLTRRIAALKSRQQPPASSTNDQQPSHQRHRAPPTSSPGISETTQPAFAAALEAGEPQRKPRRRHSRQIDERFSLARERDEDAIDRVVGISHRHQRQEQEMRDRAEQRRKKAVDALAAGTIDVNGLRAELQEAADEVQREEEKLKKEMQHAFERLQSP